MSSPALSNGRLIRFIGRHRIQDGFMLSLISLLVPIFPVLQLVIYKIYAKKTWKESLFQLFSLGQPPQATDLKLVEPVNQHLRIVCISDTHMRHANLEIPMGDILVHSGDFTNHGSLAEVKAFASWLHTLPHTYKVIVPGNHDMILDAAYYCQYWADWSPCKESTQEAMAALMEVSGMNILIDGGVTIKGVRFWGSPWVPQHTSWKTGFNKSTSELKEHWQRTLLTKPAIDVLVTHSPARGYGDTGSGGMQLGCEHLLEALDEVNPSHHIFGHIHSDYGVHKYAGRQCIAINASSVCDYYYLGMRAPIVFDIPVASAPDDLS